MRRFPSLERRLTTFHRPHADQHLRTFSPIAGGQFKNDFNLAGFFTALNELPDRPSSFWGIDRCLRIEEAVDGFRSRLFHMGVFARAISVEHRAVNPARDARFHTLQHATLTQFFALVDRLGVDRARMRAPYFGGAALGRHPDGRDRQLTRRYRLSADHVSRRALRAAGIDAVGIAAIAGVFMLPEEGSLVGPRVEVFVDDLEFGTIIFPCYRVRHGALMPINYMAAYGVGLERLMSVTSGRNFLDCIPRYRSAKRLIERRIPAARSPLLLRDVAQVIFGIEALAALPPTLTHGQRQRVMAMKRDLKFYILNLGLTYADVNALFRWFEAANRSPRQR